jgi:proliferating cell nuclear antigen PCNA
MDTSDSKYLVKIVTLQPGNIKALSGILKENNIVEANISINQDGIEILEMDPTHVIIGHVLLNASNFDSFYCREPIKIGIDTVNLTKILKGVGTKDILTIFVEDTKDQAAGSDADTSVSFGLLIENSTKGQSTKIYIDTMDVNDRQLMVPEMNYPYHVQLPSSDLQSIVTNLKNMGGDVIKILFHKDTLQFFTKGEIGILETIRSKTSKEDSSIKIQKNKIIGDESPIIEIYVKLEKLVEFTKCSCLSPMVTIYLKNEFPLFLEYDVGSLGFIRLGVSPHSKPDNC